MNRAERRRAERQSNQKPIKLQRWQIKQAEDDYMKSRWFGLIMSVMRMHYGFGRDRLKKLYDQLNEEAEMMASGMVHPDDYIKFLKEDLDIEIR